MSQEDLAELLRAALRAPSGDNTQPWRFAVDPGSGCIDVFLDPSRDPSPMNAGQRMARIALGAAVENLLLAASEAGWNAQIESAAAPALVRIRVVRDGARRGSPGRRELLATRVTNRRMYEGRSIPETVLGRLRDATAAFQGISTHWIVDRARVRDLADLVSRADAAMLAEDALRDAFLANVRFDRPAEEPVAEGMSLASLELSAVERISLRMMPRTPGWLLRAGGSFRIYGSRVRQLVSSASGLCLVAAPDSRRETDLAVGRAVERAWLALTRDGLAAQPLMSLLIFESLQDHGRAGEMSARLRRRLPEFSRELRELAPELGASRPAFLLRFGYAPAPSGRTGRLPLESVSDGPSDRAAL